MRRRHDEAPEQCGRQDSGEERDTDGRNLRRLR
jgi:hypothetical protein